MLHVLEIIFNETIGEWVGYLIAALASGSLSWLFTIRWVRQQAKSDAMKSVQGVYQGIIEDLKRDREDWKTENSRLKSVIDEQNQQLADQSSQIAELRKALEELSKRCADNELKVLELEKKNQAQERKINSMKPLVCTVQNCPNRCTKMK